jgi:endonuclease I
LKKYITLFAFLFAHTGLNAQSVPQQIIFEGLTGNQLLDSLAVHYYPNTVLSYNNARDEMFSYIYNEDGVVFCLYTGDTILIAEGEPNPRTIANNHSPNWNTEHLYPQSKGADSGFANSDMHHLRPTRSDVNSSRGNSPFGFISDELVSNWWGEDGSQSAQPAGDLSDWSRAMGSSRFEPKDDSKGDVARSVFYFYTVYRTQADAADASFFTSMMDDLREFHNGNEVNLLESERNDAIALIQGNINPFILDTTLVRRAFFENFDTDTNTEGDYIVDFEEAIKGSYAEGIVTLNGLAWTLSNTLIGSDASDMKVGSKSARFRHQTDGHAFMELVDELENGVGEISFVYARSNFSGDRSDVAPTLVVEVNVNSEWIQTGETIDLDGVDEFTEFYSDVQLSEAVKIRIRSIDGTSGRRFNVDNITITDAADVVTSVDFDNGTQPREFALEQNYPNPFNPSTIIRYNLQYDGNVKLEVYDLIGRRIALLVDDFKEAGTHEVRFDAAGLSSGMYIYRLTSGSHTRVRKMTLIR